MEGVVEAIVDIGTDGITVGVAAFAVLVRCIQACYMKTRIHVAMCVQSFFNGASIFPFVLLLSAAFYKELFDLAVGSKLSLFLAGGIGLIFVLGELLSPQDLRASISDRPAANDESIEQGKKVEKHTS